MFGTEAPIGWAVGTGRPAGDRSLGALASMVGRSGRSVPVAEAGGTHQRTPGVHIGIEVDVPDE